MKKMFYLLSVVLFIMINIGVVHADPNDPDKVVNAYFNALKNGDIETIKSLIDPDFYQKKKELLENNSAYSDFLKNYYADHEIQSMKIDVGDTMSSANVSFSPIKGKNRWIKLILKKNKEGKWKIKDEAL